MSDAPESIFKICCEQNQVSTFLVFTLQNIAYKNATYSKVSAVIAEQCEHKAKTERFLSLLTEMCEQGLSKPR